jgi:hypothetical protein
MTEDFNTRPTPEPSGMKWYEVDDPQIAAVGYESGAEYPFGVRFPANKRQLAAGEDGSVYLYKNVTPVKYQAILDAPSIHSYFARDIKSRPDLYPYVKVEADPTQPSRSSSGTGTDMKTTASTTTGETVTQDDTPPPGTALALIDGMADDLLFTPGKVTDEQLATMRTDWLAEAKKYDISTEKARTKLKQFAKPLQKLRTGLDARAKELTGKMKRYVAGIDGEKRRLVRAVGDIEDAVLGPLTAWEQEEETRKMRLAGKVKMLENMANFADNPGIELLEETIRAVENYDTSTMQEYKVSAESTIVAVLKRLKPELERRKVAEAERSELERLRADAAARAEAENEAEASQMWTERVAAAVEAERKRAADAAAAEYAAMEAQAADKVVDKPSNEPTQEVTRPVEKTHEQHINSEAVAAFIFHCGYTRQQAIAGLTAITKGLIPHVNFSY